MLSMKLHIIFLSTILFCLFIYTKSNNDEEDYYDDEHEDLEDCQYEIDYKTYKKTKNLDLCNTLINSTLSKTRIQLHIYTNHTEEKLRLRAISSSLTDININKTLITLTTDIIEDFKYPTSLLVIDNFQLISLSTLETILPSLINIDFKLLSKNLKKTLILSKGGHKQILSCIGNFYPKQDIKILNITSTFTKPITCTKETENDRYFTFQEKIYLNKNDQKKFRLVNIHQDDQKKISRISAYTCNNPASCTNGLQNKKMLDKTVNYVLKYLQKGRAEKKPASG